MSMRVGLLRELSLHATTVHDFHHPFRERKAFYRVPKPKARTKKTTSGMAVVVCSRAYDEDEALNDEGRRHEFLVEKEREGWSDNGSGKMDSTGRVYRYGMAQDEVPKAGQLSEAQAGHLWEIWVLLGVAR